MELYKVIGLNEGTIGRSCMHHQVCGQVVAEGDVLRQKKSVANYEGTLMETIKYVLVCNSFEQCTVGFMPKGNITADIVDECRDQFVQVIKLYGKSDNPEERNKDSIHKGVALCKQTPFIEDVPSLE